MLLFCDPVLSLALAFSLQTVVRDHQVSGGEMMLSLGMIVLGLGTFAAIAAFVALCDRV